MTRSSNSNRLKLLLKESVNLFFLTIFSLRLCDCYCSVVINDHRRCNQSLWFVHNGCKSLHCSILADVNVYESTSMSFFSLYRAKKCPLLEAIITNSKHVITSVVCFLYLLGWVAQLSSISENVLVRFEWLSFQKPWGFLYSLIFCNITIEFYCQSYIYSLCFGTDLVNNKRMTVFKQYFYFKYTQIFYCR